MTREGPFWDVIAGRADPPPAAVTLGWELVAVDPDAGTIEVAFSATEQFLNPVGVVQGGFLEAASSVEAAASDSSQGSWSTRPGPSSRLLRLLP